MRTYITIWVAVLLVSDAKAKTWNEKFFWSQLDFNFESNETRNEALRSGEFIPLNNIPFGIEIWKDKIFIMIPRRNAGVLSTLNYFYSGTNTTSPKLIPYPDWKSNNVSSKSIISVFRVHADQCDRLWTVDTGSVVDFDGHGNRISSPKIRIFDLNTDSILMEYEIPSSEYTCATAFTNIVVDIVDSCDSAFAYIADPGSNALVVYSLQRNESYRIKHSYFSPDPMQTEYRIGSMSFQWDDGLFGLSLSNVQFQKTLYLHPMSSLHEFSIDVDQLYNKSAKIDIKVEGSRNKNWQFGASAYDPKTRVIFSSVVGQNSIACWNIQTKHTNTTNAIVLRDDIRMIYISDVKVDRNGNLWFISNRLPVNLYGNFDPEDVNFRIFSIPTKELIRNTVCETTRRFWLMKMS